MKRRIEEKGVEGEKKGSEGEEKNKYLIHGKCDNE